MRARGRGCPLSPIGWNLLGYRAACPEHRVITDLDPWTEDRLTSNLNVVANGNRGSQFLPRQAEGGIRRIGGDGDLPISGRGKLLPM